MIIKLDFDKLPIIFKSTKYSMNISESTLFEVRVKHLSSLCCIIFVVLLKQYETRFYVYLTRLSFVCSEAEAGHMNMSH